MDFRQGVRHRSIYLGRSTALAEHARRLLAEIQEPYRQRMLFRRLMVQARASLRQGKAELCRHLAFRGYTLKGWELRRLPRAPWVSTPFGPVLRVGTKTHHGVTESTERR